MLELASTSCITIGLIVAVLGVFGHWWDLKGRRDDE
ncbi:hypothetical protein [Azospirillum palustre]